MREMREMMLAPSPPSSPSSPSRPSSPSPAVEPGGADTLDQVALEEDEHREDRHQRQGGHREDGAPVGDGRRVGEGAQGDRDGVEAGVVEVDQRVQEVAPGEVEGEDGGGHQGRRDQRHDDPEEDAELAAAVDGGGVVQLAGDAADELHDHEDEEGLAADAGQE